MENRENGPNNPCERKHREFEIFAKAQGILFAQVVHFLIIKIPGIYFKTSKFSKSSFVYEIIKTF